VGHSLDEITVPLGYAAQRKARLASGQLPIKN